MNNPQHILDQVGLSLGACVADLGSGGGAYTFAAADIVGASGMVFAVDLRSNMTDKVRTEALERSVQNIEVISGDLEEEAGSGIRDERVNVVVVANTLFQVNRQAQLAREAVRIMKPGAQLVVVDWSDSHGGVGPPSEHVISCDQAREVFELAGCTHAHDINAGAHHYGFVMTK